MDSKTRLTYEAGIPVGDKPQNCLPAGPRSPAC